MSGAIDPRLMPSGTNSNEHYAQPVVQHYASNLPPHSMSMSAQSGNYQQSHPYFTNPARTNSDHTPDHNEAHAHANQDVDYDSSGEGAQQSPGDNPFDPKRSRACEACRGLKVRCVQESQDPDQPCKRCAKAKRQCIVTQPSRKRQKKSDNRVAELEKKLDALTAVLHAQQQSGPLPPIARPDSYDQRFVPQSLTETEPSRDAVQSDINATRPSNSAASRNHQGLSSASYASPSGESKKRKLTQDLSTCLTSEQPQDFVADQVSSDDLGRSESAIRKELSSSEPDIIIARIRSLVEPAVYTKIFNRYVEELSPHLPAVVFPPGTTAEEVLKEKPMLFLCIVASACIGFVDFEVQRALSIDVVNATADSVIRSGNKSLEIVQALQVSIMWYKPLEKPDQANFYQIIHIGAVMGLDIGLGRRYNPGMTRRGFGGPRHDMLPKILRAQVDSDTVEARRAWLGCYYLCASVSMVLRRPNLIRWTAYMQECIEFLETSPDALPTDRLFAQHVRIQHICEEIQVSFMMDDASATTISISDPKVSYTLNVLEQKLKDWEDQVPKDLQKPELMFFRDVTSLYLHEIAMHVNHNIDDFRLPFTEESLRSGSQYSETLTQKQMAALEACLSAAHGIIDNYCNFGLEVLMSLPTLLFFVRCVYALIVLVKMHMAVITPGSELGKIIKVEDLKVEQHIARLWELFVRLAPDDPSRPSGKAIRILGLVREWFFKHKDGEASSGGAAAAGTEKNNAPPTRGAAPARGGKAPPTVKHSYGSRPSGDSKLHLLSEAATSSSLGTPSEGSSEQYAPRSGTTATSTSWTYDSPTAVPYAAHTRPGWSGLTGSPSRHDSTANTYVPQIASSGMYNQLSLADADGSATDPSLGDPYNSNGGGFGSGAYTGANDNDNFDWTAGMDLDQVLNGAFSEFDVSGDLGGWFMGDSIAGFQIPGDGTAGGAAGRY